jgi:hypothetical protein
MLLVRTKDQAFSRCAKASKCRFVLERVRNTEVPLGVKSRTSRNEQSILSITHPSCYRGRSGGGVICWPLRRLRRSIKMNTRTRLYYSSSPSCSVVTAMRARIARIFTVRTAVKNNLLYGPALPHLGSVSPVRGVAPDGFFGVRLQERRARIDIEVFEIYQSIV